MAGKYHTIVADPPWDVANTIGNGKGAAGAHYALMPWFRLIDMPIADLAADDCHLWLWCINDSWEAGQRLMYAWGFRYITAFHWIKGRGGLGYYLRNCTETCFFGIKGKQDPLTHNITNWAQWPRTGKHSEKPRQFIPEIVEKMSPGPYLELFARKRPESSRDWDCWGNETEGGADIYIPGYPVPKYSEKGQKNASNFFH